ncbi:MAG TPA: hypothetical protein VGQ53_16120 [Chitinophagaceae bacterium]|jgi:uncharacterized protein involved in exopolysaccharide biosynthesis|nr:hypothetical protein [Chitinophagaceae bacterium]
MPDLFDLMWRWRKQILLLVFTTLVVTTGIVFLVPKRYLSVSTALPASSFATDKTSVFSQNLQSLYSTLGLPDDLDKIVGTAQLDTVYRYVIAQLNLTDHFGLHKTDINAIPKAALILKKHTRVIKSDYGELKVKVWDVDRDLAASIANAIMEKLQEIHQDVQAANNSMMVTKINEQYVAKKIDYEKLTDSLSHPGNTSTAELLNAHKSSLLQQIQEYEKLLNQYKLIADAKPQALIIVERATPAVSPDQPKPLEAIVAATVLSFFFAVLTALALNKRKPATV